jgi:hypothetical protein
LKTVLARALRFMGAVPAVHDTIRDVKRADPAAPSGRS